MGHPYSHPAMPITAPSQLPPPPNISPIPGVEVKEDPNAEEEPKLSTDPDPLDSETATPGKEDTAEENAEVKI